MHLRLNDDSEGLLAANPGVFMASSPRLTERRCAGMNHPRTGANSVTGGSLATWWVSSATSPALA